MNLLEMQGDVLTLVANVKDKSTMSDLREHILSFFQERKIETDWWDELTAEQQADLKEGLEEIEHEENLVTHEEAMELFAKYRLP